MDKQNGAFERELYEKMRQNPDLCGDFELKDGAIVWNLGGYTVTVAQDYVNIGSELAGPFTYSLTHWHPDDDEIYGDVCRLGTRGNVTVIHRTLLGEAVVYMGPEAECPYRRKWLFGRYYYLRPGAEPPKR